MAPLLLMPQEIWNNVSNRLSTFRAASAADIFGFGLDSHQRKHAEVWRIIFKDDIWASRAVEQGLSPFLLGSSLPQLYHKGPSQKPLFLVLRICDRTGDSHYNADMFFTSLQQHTYDQKAAEVTFPGGIIINVKDIVNDPEYVVLDPPNVFAYRRRRPRTSFIHWDDNRGRLRTVTRRDIKGLEQASNPDSESKCYSIDIDRPGGSKQCALFRTSR